MADEIKKYKMSLPVAEIDAALIASKNAVKHTPQTLTEEQKAQARANIGAASGVGLPYFALTATIVPGEAVDLADEDRAALLSIIDPMVSSGKALPIVAAIPSDGPALTAVLSAVTNIVDASEDWLITYGGNLWAAEGVLSVELIVNSAGMATIKVDTINISGADTEAIAAELEGIVNGEY